MSADVLHSDEPTVGIAKGDLVCPKCWSLCVPRIVKRLFRRKVEWVWWCGCGWTSEEHASPGDPAGLVARFAEWRRLNNWPDSRSPNVNWTP